MSKQISPSDFSLEEQDEIKKKIYTKTKKEGRKRAGTVAEHGSKHWMGVIESSRGPLHCKGYFGIRGNHFRYMIEGLGPYDNYSAAEDFFGGDPDKVHEKVFGEDPYCPAWAKP